MKLRVHLARPPVRHFAHAIEMAFDFYFADNDDDYGRHARARPEEDVRPQQPGALEQTMFLLVI